MRSQNPLDRRRHIIRRHMTWRRAVRGRLGLPNRAPTADAPTSDRLAPRSGCAGKELASGPATGREPAPPRRGMRRANPACDAALAAYPCRRMSRSRALLALLLAVAWCSALWHAELEAIGLMMEHEHDHAAASSHHHDSPRSLEDEHDSVVARVSAKDTQVRLGALVVLGLALIAWVGGVVFGPILRRPDNGVARKRGRHDPPLRRVWQFVRRCAPRAAAPPAWA